MSDLLLHGLETARKKGASYADIRWVNRSSESISVQDTVPQSVKQDHSTGIGIRVLTNGAWGFAASSVTSNESVQRLAEQAVKMAKASALMVKKPVNLAPVPVATGSYATKVKQDPFEIPLTEKLDLLQKTTNTKSHRDIKYTRADLTFFKEKIEFASTEGSHFEQEFTQSGAGVTTKAVKAGIVGTRSYPAGNGGNHHAAGYEFILELDLPGQIMELQQEAVALLKAPASPKGLIDLIIDSSQMTLQLHESCGHPLELDRIFGNEISLAGGSFVKEKDRGTLKYASPLVTVTADSTLKGGLGTFKFDDEGVPAGRTVLIEAGMLKNFLTSRETAADLQMVSNGTMRADGWKSFPIIRMTNINLEPGDWTLQQMIRDLRHGLLVKTNTSWSIDDLRLNFQFATEIGYLIKDGVITEIVKNPVYYGKTPRFWNSCDAVGNSSEWRLWGIDNCGKGEPLQIMRVGHGTGPARFRGVKVGF